MSRTRPLALLLLLALAAGSWWLAGGSTDRQAAEQTSAGAQPGYYLQDATLAQSDQTGRTTLSAHAQRATQSDTRGAVALQTLTLHYYPEPGRDWVMTSNTGLMPAGTQTVVLDGDVELHAAGAVGGTAAVVRTEHLQLDLASHLATTAEPVRIELAPHALLARGLRADLTRETLRLESAVHGTFRR